MNFSQQIMESRKPIEGQFIVHGIPKDHSFKESDLDRYFSPFGRLTEARLIRHNQDWKPRGFAFITYENPKDAVDAMRAMEGKNIGGDSNIRCEFSVYNSASGGGNQGHRPHTDKSRTDRGRVDREEGRMDTVTNYQPEEFFQQQMRCPPSGGLSMRGAIASRELDMRTANEEDYYGDLGNPYSEEVNHQFQNYVQEYKSQPRGRGGLISRGRGLKPETPPTQTSTSQGSCDKSFQGPGVHWAAYPERRQLMRSHSDPCIRKRLIAHYDDPVMAGHGMSAMMQEYNDPAICAAKRHRPGVGVRMVHVADRKHSSEDKCEEQFNNVEEEEYLCLQAEAQLAAEIKKREEKAREEMENEEREREDRERQEQGDPRNLRKPEASAGNASRKQPTQSVGTNTEQFNNVEEEEYLCLQAEAQLAAEIKKREEKAREEMENEEREREDRERQEQGDPRNLRKPEASAGKASRKQPTQSVGTNTEQFNNVEEEEYLCLQAEAQLAAEIKKREEKAREEMENEEREREDRERQEQGDPRNLRKPEASAGKASRKQPTQSVGTNTEQFNNVEEEEYLCLQAEAQLAAEIKKREEKAREEMENEEREREDRERQEQGDPRNLRKPEASAGKASRKQPTQSVGTNTEQFNNVEEEEYLCLQAEAQLAAEIKKREEKAREEMENEEREREDRERQEQVQCFDR